MWKLIKDNWSQIVVIGAIFSIGGSAYLEYRIDAIVTAKLAEQGFARPAAVEANSESITDLEKVTDNHENRFDQLIDIVTR